MLSLTLYASKLNDVLNTIAPMFTVPEKTKAKTSFADVPKKISFYESMIALYGVPLDITTSFGKGTKRGPEAIRISSGRQIETLIFEENTDISQLGKVFDLGDLKLPYSWRFAKRPSAKHFDTHGRNEIHGKEMNIVPSVMSFLNRSIPRDHESNILRRKKNSIPTWRRTHSLILFYQSSSEGKADDTPF